MSPPRDGAAQTREFDYVTVGHVTVDVVSADGSRRPGGSAFYSALQAARLGQRALIVTKGHVRELEELMEPYRGELELEIFPAGETTTLGTSGSGAMRRQRVLAWAGPIAETITVDTQVLHLAPVARETKGEWRGYADFVGLTPQGLAREWDEETGEITLVRLTDRGHLPTGCDAVVLSEEERASCMALIREAAEAGAVVAITAGERPTAVHLPGGGVAHVGAPAIGDPRDDLGAGDVFAAAFFVALHEGRSPETAAALGNAAAALRIGGVGPDAIGDRSVIESRLDGG